MYKKLNIIILFAILTLNRSYIAYSQTNNLTNVWCFGYGGVVDFNLGSPESTYGSAIATQEGCASICKPDGTLLFYTDGSSLWNKNHVKIGPSSLGGHKSSTQSAIIVPWPGSTSKFYIFAVFAGNEPGNNSCMYLSCYQVSVSSSDQISVIPVVLNQPANSPDPNNDLLIQEKITAIGSEDGNKIWVIGRVMSFPGFVVFEVTNTGINPTPVYQSVPIPDPNNLNFHEHGFFAGHLKGSPNGKKIVMSNYYQNGEFYSDYPNSSGNYGVTSDDPSLVLYDFNNGVISNPLVLIKGVQNIYGAEFSPKSKVLFCSELASGSGKIHAFDLNNASPMQTRSFAKNLGAIQLAPDDKIYISCNTSNKLDAIENSDDINSFNIVTNAITLHSGYCGTGLPNYMPNFIERGQDCQNCIGSFNPESGREYILSAWIKEKDFTHPITYTGGKIYIDFSGNGSIGPFTPKGDIIDGWQRVEEKFKIPSNAFDINIRLENGSAHDVFFDDVRVHPVSGTMKSYVYDPTTLKLVAELDERNYATKYEYDQEGKLIRVKKETERGVFTVKEAREGSYKK